MPQPTVRLVLLAGVAALLCSCAARPAPPLPAAGSVAGSAGSTADDALARPAEPGPDSTAMLPQPY